MLMLPLAAVVVALAGADALAVAHARGDVDEVARQGARLGAAGLGPLLAGPSTAAATAAAPAAPDAWALLDGLATTASGWDRHAAAPAALAAVRIARGLSAEAVVRAEIPDDELAASQARWSALAARRDRWADVRVHALEVVAQLAAARRGSSDDEQPGFDLVAVLADDDAEVRRAGCELVPSPTPAPLRAALAAALADDGDDAVAIAAAQALCGELAAGEAPETVLRAVGADGLDRLRALLGGDVPPDAPAPALLDAARCLRADGGPDSLAALRALAATAPAPLRAPLARLMTSMTIR